MATEPLTGSRIPDLSYAPDITQLGTAVRDLADNTTPQFTSTANRDSAYTAWVSSGYAMRDGMLCVVGTKLYMYVVAATAWVEMGDAGAYTAFTPTWTSAGPASVALGNGTLTGRYRKIGRFCHFNITLTFGSTSTGGNGAYVFGNLPFTSAAYEQQVVAKASTTSGATRNWAGFAYISSGVTNALPFFPNSATPPYWEQARNTDAGGSGGTSIPYVSGLFAFGTGSNIVVQGGYETAS